MNPDPYSRDMIEAETGRLRRERDEARALAKLWRDVYEWDAIKDPLPEYHFPWEPSATATECKELPCQRCGHVHEYVDEACVSCGCALTIERAAYERGVREFATWKDDKARPGQKGPTVVLAERFLKEEKP